MTRLAALFLLVAPALAGAATDLWWDTAYPQRFRVAVNTGVLSPDKGYAGYTVRIPALDTASLIAAGNMLPDCSDLRIAYYDGLSWIELPRHVIGCDTAQTDIRFMLTADIAASGLDDSYYLYHANPAPGPLPAMNQTNVYLWYDDASIDRSGTYVRGRIDPWHGSDWDDSLVFRGNSYRYDTGVGSTSGYRRDVDERDVYIEAEFRHERCYAPNMTTGLIVRGSISSGSGGTETSDNYYASNRAESPDRGTGRTCSADGFAHDGSIVKNERTNVVVAAPNPPDIDRNRWRRQALAAWSAGPTNLAFWDSDTSADWAALAFPSAIDLQAQGTDVGDDNTNRGFAAVMTSQDRARLRNILIRRYVAAEPVLVLTPETLSPILALTKSALTVYDPFNATTNAKAIPGAWIEYTLTAVNSGAGSSDPDSVIVTEPLPANVSLFVGDIAGAGSGPIEFVDGVGTAASGLSYVFGGLGDPGDSLEFSTDGLSYAYTPVPDPDGFDPAVRYIRISPVGSFAAAENGAIREFTLRLRVRVQ